jgi:hypothetical protein
LTVGWLIAGKWLDMRSGPLTVTKTVIAMVMTKVDDESVSPVDASILQLSSDNSAPHVMPSSRPQITLVVDSSTARAAALEKQRRQR